jgi:predicted Zn-ribbon and HTH transcriptional regulator
MALVEDVIKILMEHKDGLTAREICLALKLDASRENDVYSAILKAAKVVRRKGLELVMMPPQCKKCGFTFDKPKVSRCPKCKSEWIEPARFLIR